MAIGGVVAIAAAAALCLTGCSNLGYYWQSATGHLKIMSAAKPIEEWLGDQRGAGTPEGPSGADQRIRNYAVRELKLPDNPSYRRYADLHRRAVDLERGRGAALFHQAQELVFSGHGLRHVPRLFRSGAGALPTPPGSRREGYDTSVYPVPAYSTLGWMNWAGGDPLLNTFIYYPEGELARLIFHELAHQVVYAKNDTTFNESFATAVERMGGERWLATQASPAAREEYAQYDGRRRQFRALALATRARLEKMYATAPEAQREAMKQAILEDFRDQYAKLRATWTGDPMRWRGYDQWVAQANNASFGAQAAYDELVPGFEALFEREGRDWTRFYAAVKQLADMPKDERHLLLKELH